MDIRTMGSWASYLQEELQAPYFHTLVEKVDGLRQEKEVYPPKGREFFALQATPPEKVRVVVLGQDPYHEPGQAMGLAFSVAEGIPYPPSLRNIFKELQEDLGASLPTSGDLTPWAEQGVLLLNTVLTVERGKANSHSTFGWQQFTDSVITATNTLPQPIVFILWGAQAQKKTALICTASPRLILRSPHPSPLSSYRGFFGSKPFSQVNDFLQAQGESPIEWNLP